MKLKDALEIREKEVICLVGGGGKTTLMFALARELADGNGCVITTTTTKIFKTEAESAELLILDKDPGGLLDKVKRATARHRHITVAREVLANGKLAGIAPATVGALAALATVSHIIIEADGAAHHPLKAPAAREPVIPSNTSLIIAVVGIDALGGRLAAGNVFRAEIAAQLLGVPVGAEVTPEIIAGLVTRRDGIAKGSPETARIVPFLNKTDIADGLAKGRRVARAILAGTSPQIDTVLLGRVQYPDPVAGVIRRGE